MNSSREKVKKRIDKNIIDKKNNIKKSNLIIIIVTIIIVISIYYLYHLFSAILTDRIVKMSLRNMWEISKHDEQSIISGLEHRWMHLEGIAKEVEQNGLKTTSEVLRKLNIKSESIETTEVVLITEEGKVFSSTQSIYKDTALLELCKNSPKDKFVQRIDKNKNSEVNSTLLLGTKIEPFTIDENRFIYVAGYYRIENLTDELKIESYNGEGYSSVIDKDGYYLVSVHDNDSLAREDFYTVINKEGITSDLTLEEVREKIENRESFYLEYLLDGQNRIMVCNPMTVSDWYCIMSVPLSIYQAQSAELLQLLTILIIAILIAITIVVILIFRNRSQKNSIKFEIKHRDELESALTLAEQASRAKTTFLNNMSHDIRTPMNAIIGFTTLAKNNINNKERVEDYLDKISQSSNHLLSLINDVLDMSRIESGKVNIEEKEENLAEILHGIRNIVQADVNAKQMEFVIDTVDITDENIYCDKLRLNQILINLLSNALKFTEPGGTISVRITQKPISKKGYGIYEFRVKDNGIGISEEFIKEIFEPFARERSSTVSGIQGTGLGMAITKNIVDMMGGTIEVQSKVGKGTEFIVTLEFKLQEAHKKIEVIDNLKDVHALVVDDDMNSCQSISHMLRQLGLKSDWTMYGKEAVARAKEAHQMKEQYQIYLIDWLMPDMNGIETTRRIRKIVGKEPVIIMLSAYDWGEIEKEAKEAGVTEFISKPLFPSDLRKILLKVSGLDKKQEKDEEKIDFSGKRILLVEDNMMNREIATEYLQDFGFLVESAENGKEACEILEKSEPGYFDVVLMDVQMPIMDGYEATKTIRKFKNKKIANIPILAMTANAFDEDKKAAKEAGMNGHLAKPIDIPKLIEALREILN